MTTIATAVAVAVALAGAYQTKQVAKKQDNIAAQGIRQQGENQRKVNKSLNKTLDDTEKSNPNGAKKKANDAYLQAIQAAMGGANKNLVGNSALGEFNDGAEAASWQAQDYAGNIAGLLSRVDAGTQQRQAEGNLLGDFTMDANRLGGDIQGDAFLNRLRMGGVRRNPYLDAAAGVAQGWASSGGGGGSGSGMTSATADTGFRFGPTG